MRILQFGRFGDPSRGGIERHVTTLSKYLVRAGAEVVNLVAAPNFKDGRCFVDGYELVEAASMGVLFSTALSPQLLLKARALHADKPFDVAHLHFPDPLSHAAALILPASVKRVITWHSDIVKQRRLLKFYAPFQKRILENVDAVVAGTEAHFSSSTQIQYESLKRPVVIPYGLDYSALQKTEKNESMAKTIREKFNKPIIFALGRHVYYKGFSVLIDAMRGVDAHLILGGTGPLSVELQKQVRDLGLDHKITFAGRIPDPDLPAYFDACSLFCLPSVEPSEAFGLVQLEAMACGKPVLCTQLNNGVNVVNQDNITGLAVPPNDSNALASAIRRLIGDKALSARLGAAGMQRALSVYSAKNMAAQHIDLYEQLIT